MAIKTNVADYLTQIEKLTNTNLQILKTINDSFFTKQNHIMTEINDTKYVIPSFISLENKINMLQENFENLVNSPESGEAYFSFDGNSRSIEVRKYNHTPDSVTLPTVTSYSVDANNAFKDFVTPVPYINFDLPTLPNDIVDVNVKKIVAKSDAFKNILKEKLAYTKEEKAEDGSTITNTYYNTSVNESYSFMNKLLINYKKDIDYVDYDTLYKMPIRKNIGVGTYVIESVIDDKINEKLEEIITLKLRNNLKDASLNNTLTYKIFDETIEKPLKVGDELVNYNGTGKVVITEIRPLTNTILVKVVNGEYLNFIGTDSYDSNNDTDIHDMSKLRFYDSIDFDADKYLKVPLEEDQYVFICVAPVNSRMNLQSSWGTGVIIDTYKLMNQNITFSEYYRNNVNNIGDLLFEMTSMITSPITSLSKDEFNSLSSIKPTIDSNCLSVMQINKHLNDSVNIKNIRNAYRQKKTAESSLSSLQEQIDDINTKLATISFDDTAGTRNMYVSQLSKLNAQKTTLIKTINSSIEVISMNVNSSEIPIDNAKYRIRGFYIPNFELINGIDVNKHVIGLNVQYRYKNNTTELGNAVSINGSNNKTYIYSDWNTLTTPLKSKIAKFNDVFNTYSYEYEENNEDKNEPSYNQIDIPISQGETVDIRLKVIYDYGQPYTTFMSDWSDIINVEFPAEFTKDVPILTIIEENNSDIETNRFNGILETSGVNSHIEDRLIDQNITFYHKPDSIASGFYTEERRIIPLKDKLVSMSNEIAQIKSDLLGSEENCKVSIIFGENNIPLYYDRNNTVILDAYSSITNSTDGTYMKDSDGRVSTMLNIAITNIGSVMLKLYPLFPGNRNISLNSIIGKNDKLKNNYCNGTDEGVWFKYKTYKNSEESTKDYALQTLNQFITFRMNDVWTNETYYNPTANYDGQTINQTSTHHIVEPINVDSVRKSNNTKKGALKIYPFVDSEFGLCVNSDSTKSYLTLNPGEQIIVPLYCEYFMPNNAKEDINHTISFDLRTSLYNDPVNYSFNVIAKHELTTQDKVINKNKVQLESSNNSLKYNSIIK